MATYTMRVEVGDADGGSWLAVAPSETVEYDGDPRDLARDVAANQTVADGDDWRVVVWGGGVTSSPIAIYYNN